MAWGKDVGADGEASQRAVPAIVGNLMVSPNAGSQLGAVLSPRGHLAVSGDIFVATARVCVCVCVLMVLGVEARGAACHRAFTGHTHHREWSGPNVSSAKVEKP